MGSLYYFVKSELSRGYQLEHDEERYEARREKVYTFMKIPRELEKFLGYGFLQCIDAFLYLFTFLPIRFTLAFIALVTSPAKTIIRLSNRRRQQTLQPSEIVDLLKGTILIIAAYVLSYIDTAMVYHMIKSQSVIKLYLFYNMLEMADRLFSVFGQDIIDALFWTATEPRRRKREHLGLIPHLFLAMTYVFLHSVLILFQATTLNVAINSSNKALLTIMMSNNFVELKSSVFKKFDKSNLFQLSCADVRERFHLIILLLVVVLQTMKEYMWREERFWVLLPDCLMVLLAEILVDWIKHAFITRFNEISAVVYRDYTLSLAYDLAQTRQKHAFTDHSDLVARRMGFIPLPLGVLVSRIITQSLKISCGVDILIILLAYLGLTSFRILNGIVALGKACDLIESHHKSRTATKPEETRNEPEAFCRSQSVDSPRSPRSLKSAVHKTRSVSHSPPRVTQRSILRRRLTEESEGQQRELAFQPMFSNSTVSLTSLCLNEEIFDDVMEPTLVYENSNGKDL